MGNRATVEFRTKDFHYRPFFYLHWNGGMGSVQAFLIEAIKRATNRRDLDKAYEILSKYPENFLQYIPLNFYSVVQEFFGGLDSLYVVPERAKNQDDNGHYVISFNKKNGIVIRQEGQQYTESPEETKQYIERITKEFDEKNERRRTNERTN